MSSYSPEPALLLENIAEGLLSAYPENATHLGLDHGVRAGLRGRLADRSAEGVSDIAGRAAEWLEALDRLPPGALSPDGQSDAEVARTALGLAVEGFAFGYGDISALSVNFSHRNTPYVVAQNTGAFVETPEFLETQHRLRDPGDADAYLERLAAYGAALDGEAERIASDGARGVVLPSFLIGKTIAQLRAGLARQIDEWQVVRSLGEKLAAPRARELGQARAIARERIAPAIERQIAALSALQPAATDDAGAWKLPDGEAYYAWALRSSTTTTLSPDEVHDLGLEQVRDLHGRMDGLLRRQGLSDGSVPARMAILSRSPDNLYPNTAAGRELLLSYLSKLTDNIREQMPRVFRTLVPGRLEIRRISPDIEQGAPDGYAGPGSIDGTIPGHYFINLRDTAIWPRFALPTLTYHEGIPGHVWQGEYANRLPLLRSLLSFSAYAEGWALYAEQLADELGAYESDPLGQLGYLQSLCFRACRLVVDTGLHAKRWSREQAIRWFAKHSGSPDSQIAGEVDRYCVWPAQCCSYKIGHNEMNRIRGAAQSRLGTGFDLRRFNDALVQCGNVPLTMLDAIVADRLT